MMKGQKIYILVIILLFNCFTVLIGSKTNIQINLSVRVFVDNQQVGNLKKDDFKLLVNDQETEIVEFASLGRSISQKSDLGRSFILSFQTAEYNQSVSDGISYFITQNVNRNDILFIVSPLKYYQIRVTGSKENMIRNIDRVLKEDFHTYKKSRTSIEKSLLNKIQKVKTVLVNKGENDYDIYRYTTVIQFINNYPLEFLGFKRRFLFPDTLKIKQIADRIASRGGDRWWIHFQQREVSALFPKSMDLLKKLNWYETIASYNLGYKQGLSHLKKQLQFSHQFPSPDMTNIFLKNNISYNVILFSGKKDLDLTNVQSEISDLKIIFNKISQESGGKIVSIMTPEQGIREIEKHWDFYFELGFQFDGRFEDKQFKIELKNGNANLQYTNILSRNEIKSVIKQFSEGKIKIENLSSNEKSVSFSVGLFKLHQKEKYGIIKVSIKLFNDQNKIVYTKNNILRAFNDAISISIPYPDSYRGKYKMKIAVFDMIANHSDSVERFLEL